MFLQNDTLLSGFSQQQLESLGIFQRSLLFQRNDNLLLSIQKYPEKI
jgi:hypothetical protein